MGFKEMLARVRGNTPRATVAGEARVVPSAEPNSPERVALTILPAEGTYTGDHLVDEALYAHQLLQRAAETGNPIEAVTKVREFAALVRASPQAEIYDLQGIQEAFGEHAVRTIVEKHAGSLTVTPPPGVPSLEVMVDKVVKSLKYLDSTQCSDLLNVEVTTEVALTKAYEHVLKGLALIVAENIGDIARVAIPRVVEDYEQARVKYREHATEGPLPEIEFQQGGEQKKRSTDRVVYRGANFYYINLAGHLIENAHPLNARLDDFKVEIEGIIEKVASYISQCEYTSAEQEALLTEIRSIGKTLGQKVQQGNQMAEEIEARHDQLYDRFNEASSLYRAQILFDQFVEMSATYSAVLGTEDLGSILEHGRTKLAQFGATLDQEEDGRFVIRKPGEEEYVLTIRNQSKQSTPLGLDTLPIATYDLFCTPE